MDLDGTHEEDAEGEDEEPQLERTYGTSMRGRRVTIAKYKESDSEPDPLATADYDDERNGGDGADFDEEAPRPTTRRIRPRHNPVVLSSDEGEMGNGRRYATRSQSKRPEPSKSSPNRRLRRGPFTSSSRLQVRDGRRPGLRSRRTTHDEDDGDGYVDVEQPHDSADDSMEDAVPEASSDLVVNEEEDADAEGDVEVNGDGEDEVLPSDGKPYALRQRAKVNYAIPPPLDEIPVAPPKPASGRQGGGRSNWNRSSTKKGPGWSANGAELSRFLGLPGEDSVCGIRVALPHVTQIIQDSDVPTRAPRKGFGNAAFTGGLNGLLPGDLAAAAGTPANFGKVGDAGVSFSRSDECLTDLLAALADADPLGVNQNVTFDEVGGLDDRLSCSLRFANIS
jgi:hypothetical protein